MARILLTCTADGVDGADPADVIPLRLLREFAALDSRGQHEVTNDPGVADIILFVESIEDAAYSGRYYQRIRRHPLFREAGDRCFVHSGIDQIVPTVRGIFPSVQRRGFLSTRTRSGPYLVEPNPFLRYEPLHSENAEYLASFVGVAGSHPIRHALIEAVSDPSIVVEDTGDRFLGSLRSGDTEVHESLKAHFVDVLLASRFALCPRGFGASTMRLFEALQLGRAPVIVSDQWTAPNGPDWASFSVRVPERELGSIPERLRAIESEAESMGARARQAWVDHFSPEATFHWTVEACLEMLETSALARTLDRGRVLLQLLRPRQLIRFARGR